MNSRLTVLITDDEPHSRNILEKMLQQHIPEISHIGQADTVKKALAFINEFHPQVVFLDIHMQGESGFDLLQQIPRQDFEVIFVTAYDNYAIRAFRFNAVDYLLKPVVVGELKEAFSKAMKKNGGPAGNRDNIQRLSDQLQRKNILPQSITVPTSEGFTVLHVPDIIYCQASNNYTIFHMANKQKILSSQTLGVYEELLSGHNFFRAHRSYLINLNQIASYKKGEGGYIVMNNGDEVELSRNNKADFLQLFRT